LADFLIQNNLQQPHLTDNFISEGNSFKRHFLDHPLQANPLSNKSGEKETEKRVKHPLPPNQKRSEDFRSENTPEHLGQSSQNKINSKKILEIDSKGSGGKNEDSGNKRINSEHHKSAEKGKENPNKSSMNLQMTNALANSIAQAEININAKKSSPRKLASKPKIPNVRHSPNKRPNSSKNVIDDLIASHKATTMKMESLNFNISGSLKKCETVQEKKIERDQVHVKKFES
jgi:hypothetical protein